MGQEVAGGAREVPSGSAAKKRVAFSHDTTGNSARQMHLIRTKSQEILHKQAERIAKHAEKHDDFYTKFTYSAGVVGFGLTSYLVGARPHTIPYLYCFFFSVCLPLRWLYYRSKKWHYFLLDFCYYANVIFMVHLLMYPSNKRLNMVSFAFAEGPLAWALIVWRCSLVFSSLDKIVSVLIHLIPGLVFFIIRWWDPHTFSQHRPDEAGPWGNGRTPWPVVEDEAELWTWLFVVPLVVYGIWQALYWLIVEGLRKQRLLRDPAVLTSFRELSRKASRANNIWWKLSGVLGDSRRVVMYALLQGLFTVATMALTVPMFKHYRLHMVFQIFKISTSVWYGGQYLFDVMPKQVAAKQERKKATSSTDKKDAMVDAASGDDDISTAEAVFADKCRACGSPTKAELEKMAAETLEEEGQVQEEPRSEMALPGFAGTPPEVTALVAGDGGEEGVSTGWVNGVVESPALGAGSYLQRSGSCGPSGGGGSLEGMVNGLACAR